MEVPAKRVDGVATIFAEKTAMGKGAKGKFETVADVDLRTVEAKKVGEHVGVGNQE
jgi:hypothetical protein